MRRNGLRCVAGAVALAALLPAMPAAAAPIPTAKYALAAFGHDQGWRTERHIRTLTDVTRDGKADIVGFGEDGVWTSIALGDGNFTQPRRVLTAYGYNSGWRIGTHPRWVTDITNDGLADLVGIGSDGVWTAVGNGDGTFGTFSYVLAAFGSTGRPSPMSLHVADANLDGRTDIYAFSNGRVDVALASGAGNYSAPYLASTEFTSDRFDFNHFKLANIGGDARPDILSIRHLPGIAPMSTIARADGTYGTSQTSTSNPDQSGNAIFRVADVTGDGYADAVRFGNDVNTYTGRAIGAGTFTTFGVGVAHFGYNNGTGYGTATQPSPSLGNISNDNRADIVGFSSSGVMSAVSRGDGTFAPARRVNADFGSGRGWTVAQHPRLLADVTGEGWADVVGFGNAGVFVGLSNGSGGFGGGPEVAIVPSLRGLLYDQAVTRLAAEGLRVGSIRGVPDRTCENIDRVLSSNPSAGTEVAVGTAVTLSIGERPPTPCP
ncbi:PASTA domain-containing protein [Lentzea sp. PSKA42]|uniref:PASTA domain-containing protein n=1 Tax=Lentzea indica TaxID=2604800 RepID=A0ABX1FSC7_9PSEU|nr:FG-GAP-like repeat-containing protein [Lentzea indica]NKE61919.1 PASTA domain-containing protein [Lentzea indica]